MKANYLFFWKIIPRVRSWHSLYKNGRKIYEFALTTVPAAMKSCLDKSGIAIDDQKILIHQANEKMDEAIIQRFYKLYDRFLRILCLWVFMN
jgi:3-oxoacyl-[acyl-carrier-protein] synthase-3